MAALGISGVLRARGAARDLAARRCHCVAGGSCLSPARDPQEQHYRSRLRERHPAAYARFAESPAATRYLDAAFSHSRFLAEAILGHPEWVDELIQPGYLDGVVAAEQLRARLIESISGGVPPPFELARFRRRQILRIMLRDVLALGTLPEITGELTTLADVILDVAYDRIHGEMSQRYGAPVADKGGEAHFAVIALGKMGAEELNYSSDIDLMFLYSANGETSGARRITNREFFKRAANQLTGLLSAYSAEGMCYRVDLRLRPDGSLGEACISLEGAEHYYAQRARDWELQMLIKARAAAGHRPTGRALLEFVESRIYATSTDFTAIEQLSATRERLNEKLNARPKKGKAVKAGVIDVKLERGGIRDVEFLVQCLQRLHGGAEPWVQHRGTLLALARLHDKGVLKAADYGRLAGAYQFFRQMEHRLQLEEDRQTHALPRNAEAMDRLARNMPGGGTPEALLHSLRGHFDDVIGLYERVVHAGSVEGSGEAEGFVPPKPLAPVDQRAPELAAAFANAHMERGSIAFEHFLARLADDPATLKLLNSDAELTATAIDLFEHSAFFGEELIRRPDAVLELNRSPQAWIRDEPPPAVPAELRRWYKRGILRIEAESVCRWHKVFDTLASTSELADAVIDRAYKIAVEEVRAAHPPEDPGYQPVDQMWVIALGRLGMREFDLGSDADLTFVLADSDGAELAYWMHVAKRIVQLIGSYTGEGILFTVDTRLRPNGAAGLLVQPEMAVLEYFIHTAEAWESITYLKARSVAGNRKRAEAFLHELQLAYGDRYGQSGNSRLDLREMRARLEREQGPGRPLKAGRGGYYDIDFLLLYLRLKNTGVYYSYLNTPARIEVLETSERLSRGEADLLLEAATFYRALDHALRVMTGHAEGRLPRSDAQRDALNAVLPRWTPVPLSALDRIKDETRALFDRFFY
ncbi:MAG: glutamine-synthetase adenylyltransferase [Acidobacteriota bacterium]